MSYGSKEARCVLFCFQQTGELKWNVSRDLYKSNQFHSVFQAACLCGPLVAGVIQIRR